MISDIWTNLIRNVHL